MPDYSVIIPRYLCWAIGPHAVRAPTVLRALTAADAIAQAELLLRHKPWSLESVEPYEKTHAKLSFFAEPWGRGAADST